MYKITGNSRFGIGTPFVTFLFMNLQSDHTARAVVQRLFIHQGEGRMRAPWRILATTAIFILAAFLLRLLAGGSFWFPVILSLAVLLSLWFASVALDRRPFREFGLALDKPWIRDLAAGIVIAFLAICLIFSIQMMAGWLTFTGFGWERYDLSSLILPLAAYFLLMAGVSLWEEAWFRGYLITNLREGFQWEWLPANIGIFLAVFLSSALFGLLHLGNPGAGATSAINIAIAGMVLAYPFVATGSLAMPIGLHFSWNVAQGALFGFPVSGIPYRHSLLTIEVDGPDLMTGGAFGPEAGIAGLYGLLLLLLLAQLYIRRYYGV